MMTTPHGDTRATQSKSSAQTIGTTAKEHHP